MEWTRVVAVKMAKGYEILNIYFLIYFKCRPMRFVAGLNLRCEKWKGVKILGLRNWKKEVVSLLRQRRLWEE